MPYYTNRLPYLLKKSSFNSFTIKAGLFSITCFYGDIMSDSLDFASYYNNVLSNISWFNH